MDDATVQMLGRLAAPESRESAARQIVDSYVNRLLPLIQSELSPAIRQRIDPEDVMQSVWRTFFNGDFSVSSGNDLGAFLARLCVNKARDNARRQTAEKRDVYREISVEETQGQGQRSPSPVRPLRIKPGAEAHAEPLIEDDSFFEQDSVCLLMDGPDPDQATIVREAIEHLPQHLKAVMTLRLKGLTAKEAAQELGCTRRTVVRRIGLLKSWFRKYFRDS